MISEILVEMQPITWLPWSVSYFFFIGIAFCAVFCAGLLWVAQQPKIELMAVSIALITGLVAPIALTADLHQPARVLHFYSGFAWWSWMAWGAILLPWFSLSIVGYFLCLLAQHCTTKSLPFWLKWLKNRLFLHQNLLTVARFSSLLSAIGLLVYTVMETYNTGRALWQTYWLFPLMLFSALPTSVYLSKFMFVQFAKQQAPVWLARLAQFSLLGLLATLCGFYFSSSVTQQAIAQLFLNAKPWLYGLFGLIALALFSSVIAKLSLLTLVCSLAITWCVRWILVMQGQVIAKTSAVQNDYDFMWGHTDGGLGILAVFGLSLLLGVMIWHLYSVLFTVQEEAYHE